MRSSSWVALLVLGLAACGGEAPPPAAPPPPPAAPPPPPPTATQPPAPPPKPPLAQMEKQALGTAHAALNEHDAKKFASVYSDDAVIAVAGLNEVRGRDGIAQNMTEWFDTFKDIKLGFSRVWVNGATMAIEWVINGKHHGELFGVKGTEQTIGHYGLSVVTFDQDGKVTRENRYGELGAVMSQVGAGGAKAKAQPIPAVPDKPEVFPAKGTPDEDKNVATAKSVLAALESKKEADFTGALTDDVQQEGTFALETPKGKDGAKKFFKAFTTAFPDAKFDMTTAFGAGDYAILDGTLTATHKGPLGPIAATKRPIKIHLAEVFQIKDGKVAHVWTYQNSLELQEQLGMFSVKAPGNIPASQMPPAKKPEATPAEGAGKKK